MAIREHSIYDCILSNAQNFAGETALVSGDLRTYFCRGSTARQLPGTWTEEHGI